MGSLQAVMAALTALESDEALNAALDESGSLSVDISETGDVVVTCGAYSATVMADELSAGEPMAEGEVE
jgi:hypothetical protein